LRSFTFADWTNARQEVSSSERFGSEGCVLRQTLRWARRRAGFRNCLWSRQGRRSKRWRLVDRPIARNGRAPRRSPGPAFRGPPPRRHANAPRRAAGARRGCGPVPHARRIVCAGPGVCGQRSSPAGIGQAGLRGRKHAESLGIRKVAAARKAWSKAEYCRSSREINQGPMCAGVAHPTGLHPWSLLHATI